MKQNSHDVFLLTFNCLQPKSYAVAQIWLCFLAPNTDRAQTVVLICIKSRQKQINLHSNYVDSKSGEEKETPRFVIIEFLLR